ncbi:transporter [Kiritimatiellota bacterium B12222]|nr:transporter [Kiritimatiellota bacterium B12222]
MKTKFLSTLTLALTCIAFSAQAQSTTTAQDDEATKLAKQLANPVASLISVPFQFNYDENIGANDEGSKFFVNIQPVIPLDLSEDWNLIIRTIVPVIELNDIPASGDSESGLGDITQSFFFSPKEPVKGWILAAGPVGLYPSASDDFLGTGKWGAGPTALALQQKGPWTYGLLWNHVWSVGGDSDREDVNASYIQPFLGFITKTKTTLMVNTESTYNWEGEEWSVPVNVMVSQLAKLGPQIVQFSLGARYWVESTESGPEGWGARAQVILLFPK